MNVELVAPANVDAVWPLISSDIADCLESTVADCSAGDLLTLCRTGACFLMVAHDGEAIKCTTIWRFETWPAGTVFKNLICVGTDMETWLPASIEKAHDMARMGGARFFSCEGRKGWGRIFPKARAVRTTYLMEV